MRKFLLVLGTLVLLTGAVLAQEPEPGAAGAGDSYFPTLGNGGYDVIHYTIDLTADVETNAIESTVTIDAEALQPLSRFNLDFYGFDIETLTVDGADADYVRRSRELIITPETPLDAGDAFQVIVAYAGVPGADFNSGSPTYTMGWTNYERGVFVASEPAGAANWYPSNDHPLDKATYTFRITVDEPYVVAANGLLQETIDHGDTLTYVWESAHPMASYLATVNIGDFVREDIEGPDGVPIRNYFPRALAERGSEVFAPQAEMMAFFSDLYGPYPFEAYGVVVADIELSFALETQTLSLFGRDILFPFNFGARAEEVVAHELAHQWFGDSVTPARWQDVWLNEGFATYSEALWFEHSRGPEQFDAYMRGMYGIISQPALAASVASMPGLPPPNNLFNRNVYLRGAWTLHALRLEVGDEAFFEIVRTYYERHKYGNATTQDLIAIAEEVSGQSLERLFNLWLFQPRVPAVPQLGLSARTD